MTLKRSLHIDKERYFIVSFLLCCVATGAFIRFYLSGLTSAFKLKFDFSYM